MRDNDIKHFVYYFTLQKKKKMKNYKIMNKKLINEFLILSHNTFSFQLNYYCDCGCPPC